MVARQSVMIDPNRSSGAKSPEFDKYVLTFDRIEDYGLSAGYQGEEPKDQFTLIFVLHAPDDDECDGMEIKGWYTPKFKAIPGKIVPKLYTLLRALNGGEYEQPSGPYDGWDELERFTGRQFRCDVGPNTQGWARLQGDPMPLRSGKKKSGSIEVVVLDPAVEDAADEQF